MSLPIVTVLPTAGGNPELADTLKSLAACRKPDRYQKTIVVENGPAKGAQQMVEQARRAYPQESYEYLHVERANKSNALNECLNRLEQDCLLFLTDDDVTYDPALLEVYARHSEGVMQGVVYGGPIKVQGIEDAPAELTARMPLSHVGFPRGAYRPGLPFIGSNWAAFSQDIQAAGGFDPRFGPGSQTGASGQETEAQWRLQKLGCSFQYLPEAVVWHIVEPERFTPEFLGRRAYNNGVTRGILLRDQYEAGQAPNCWRSLAADRFYSLVLPCVCWCGGSSWRVRCVEKLHRARGRLRGWQAVARK